MSSPLIFDYLEISGFMSFPPNIRQRISLNTNRLTAILGENLDIGDGERNGCGKAQPLSAKVLTPAGWVRMGDVKVGDNVITPDGKQASILAIYPQGKLPVYRITFVDGRQTETCGKHLWKTWGYWNSKWSWQVRSTLEVSEQMKRRSGFVRHVFVPLVIPSELQSDHQLPIDPYLLGVLLGDGTITPARTAITTTDQQIVDECNSLLPTNHTLSKNRITYTIVAQKRISIHDRPAPKGANLLRQQLKELNLVNETSYTKSIPEMYRNGSTQQRLALLQGLLDTDGEASKNGGISFSTTSKTLASDVQKLVWSLGGISKISPRFTKYIHNGERRIGAPSYRLSIRLPRPKSAFRLERKLSRLKENNQYSDSLRLRISSIDEVGEKECQCILIDHPDHLYITDDWIVTHNTAVIDALLYVNFGRSPRISNQGFVNIIEPGPLLVTQVACRDEIAFLIERGENPSLLRLFEKPETDPRDFRHKEAGKFIFETTKSTKPETSKRIVELLGFDLKLSDVLLYNNPSDRACFFLKSEDEQRTVVERIFGFSLFSEKAERLRELRKEENKNLTTKESALIATKQANDRLMVRITELEEKSNTWAAERDKLIRFLTQQIKTFNGIDFEHEISVLTKSKKLYDDSLQIDQEIKNHEKSLGALQQKHEIWAAEQATTISGLTSAIEKMQSVDAATEIEIIKQRVEVEEDIDKLLAAVQATAREREPYQRSLDAIYASRNRIAGQIEIIEQQIIQLNLSKCPTCGQDWADTQNHTLECIDELDAKNAELKQVDEEILDLKTLIKKLSNDADKLKMRLTGLYKVIEGLPETAFASIEDAARASSGLDEQIQRLDETKGAQNPYTDVMTQINKHITNCRDHREQVNQQILNLPKVRYEELQQATIQRDTLKTLEHQFFDLQQAENPHRETIDKLRSETLVVVDETEVRELRCKVEHLNLLISLLADRDSPIRKSILNEWLPELNSRVNTYLETLELPHRVVFDPNMTASFSLDGKPLSFGNLSAGQRLRVWLATNRAFREIFEIMNYTINLFVIDEVLDKGMSARGAEVSYRLLEEMVGQGKSVYLITHRSELVDMADYTMTIVLENGLSTIQAS